MNLPFVFWRPCLLSFHQRKMHLICPGIYSVGTLQSSCLTDQEARAIKIAHKEVMTFKKLYLKDTLLFSNDYQGKRDSSICCFTVNGCKQYGVIQKFVLSRHPQYWYSSLRRLLLRSSEMQVILFVLSWVAMLKLISSVPFLFKYKMNCYQSLQPQFLL